MTLLADRSMVDVLEAETYLRLWARRRGLSLPADPLELAARCGFDADPWQRDVLASRAKRLLLLCCRQSGKSTVSALLGLHEAMTGGLCLVLSPTERQSAELLRKAKQHYTDFGSRVVAVAAESTTTLEFTNGGRLIALPGAKEANVRGFSGVGLLIIDEASRVLDDLYASVRPMLAVSGGRLALLSTPFGQRGFFWHAWDGGEGWKRVKVTAELCPRIPPAFLEEERRTLGDLVFRSEYLCDFVDTEESVFARVNVLAALDPAVRPLFGTAA